jgi:hypothetical protein
MKDCTNCLRRQAEEAMRNRKREMVRVNINPDSVIGEEIMYHDRAAGGHPTQAR